LWFTGSDYFQNGTYQPAQQAEAIFSVGHYLFFGDPSKQLPPLGFGYEKEREWVIENTLFEESRTYKNKNWSQRASRCVPVMLDSTETSQLRASLVALMSFLMTAPTRKDATQIKLIVEQIREELLIRTLGPMSN
jgi:hypothetical protein